MAKREKYVKQNVSTWMGLLEAKSLGELSFTDIGKFMFLTMFTSKENTIVNPSTNNPANKTDIANILGDNKQHISKFLVKMQGAGLIYLKDKSYRISKRFISNCSWREEHAKYINSKQWKDKRKLVLDRDSHKCTSCGSAESLHIHHLTYKNFKNEPLEDLTTLCKYCHAKVHNKVETEENV